MSAGAFALFIDLPAGADGAATRALRAIPFPDAVNVRLSLVCAAAEDIRIGSAGASILFSDANGDPVGTPIVVSPIFVGQFVPPTPVPTGAVAAFVELSFLNPGSLPPVTALVQFD